MSRFGYFSKSEIVLSRCVYGEDDDHVKPDLAVTPSQMMSLASQGIPVTNENASVFFDGVSNPSFDLPMDAKRGVDPAELFELEQDIKSKARKGLARDKKLFKSKSDA